MDNIQYDSDGMNLLLSGTVTEQTSEATLKINSLKFYVSGQSL